jgi:Fe-S-cluster-containing dehydrogenase component
LKEVFEIMEGRIVMSEVNLLIDYSLCTGCKICQLTCSQKKCGSFNPSRALLRIKDQDEVYHSPVVCMQCGNPACLKVCPMGAISKNRNGTVLIDNEKCTGCGICQKYCPQQVITLYSENKNTKKKAHKCDLCDGFPACADTCPTGALRIVRR